MGVITVRDAVAGCRAKAADASRLGAMASGTCLLREGMINMRAAAVSATRPGARVDAARRHGPRPDPLELVCLG